MTAAVIFYSVVAVAVILMIVERRIGKKSGKEQTDREKRFMAADMSTGRALQAGYTDPRVIHFVGTALGLMLLVLGVVWLVSGQLRAGFVGILGGAAAATYGLGYFATSSRRGRGEDSDDDVSSS